jgi:Cft2 family RNA processing exonuclease
VFVLQVITDRVFQFIAYTIGYSTLIVGDNDKLIIIDAPESYPEAVKMISQSRKHPVVACKPIEAVIISLFHLDHMWGLKVSLYFNYVPGRGVQSGYAFPTFQLFILYSLFLIIITFVCMLKLPLLKNSCRTLDAEVM